MNDSGGIIIFISMFIAGIFLFLAASGFLSRDPSGKAKELLEKQGYENVRMTGYKAFACGKDDMTSRGFDATSPNGSQVEGVVCCGLFKGCTVRFQ